MARVPDNGADRMHQTVIANSEHDTDGFKYVSDVTRPDPFTSMILMALQDLIAEQRVTNAHLAQMNGFDLKPEDVL